MSAQNRFLFHWLCLQVIFASVFCGDWEADVVPKITALTTSCVVLPCTFTYPGTQLPGSRIRAVWHKKKNHDDIIYHDDKTKVVDSFKGRTTLLGRLGEKNCTLEIEGVRDHDDGPICFRAEIPNKDKYSFMESCGNIFPTDVPEKPQLDKNELIVKGVPASFKCSVRYTCPSHPPTITWSYANSDPRVNYREINNGIWEIESLLTFIPKAEDAHTVLTCTSSFHGGKSSMSQTTIYLTPEKNLSHIIISVAAVLGTALLFGVMGFFMIKKYKKRIHELQSGNGIWSRISRRSQRNRGMNEADQNKASSKQVIQPVGSGDYEGDSSRQSEDVGVKLTI